MDNISLIWVLLHDKVALCCNEQFGETADSSLIMEYELFNSIIKIASQNRVKLVILAGSSVIPDRYLDLICKSDIELIIPVDYKGELPQCQRYSVSIEIDQVELLDRFGAMGNVILRVKKTELPLLSKPLIELAQKAKKVNIRHPQLLEYTDSDFEIYKQEIMDAGLQINLGGVLSCGSGGIDAARFFAFHFMKECGAGKTSVALSFSSEIYSCPAAIQTENPFMGNLFDGIDIPNRHLWAKEHSLFCRQCNMVDCKRCVYLNKMATMESSVPADNVCRLENINSSVTSALICDAVGRGLLPDQTPIPQELSCDQLGLMDDIFAQASYCWQELESWCGRKERITGPMMLAIIAWLHGYWESLLICEAYGSNPDISELDNDILRVKARKVTEKFRTIEFAEGLPTVDGFENKMAEMLQRFNR